MKGALLLVWTACLVALTVSVLHFVWVASLRERVLILALVLVVACRSSGQAKDGPPLP